MTYTAIPDTDVDAESPVTQILMETLRDNPIAIANGDSGAPKIQSAALDTEIIDTAAIADGAITQEKLEDFAAGSAGQLLKKTSSGASDLSYTKMFEYTVPKGGTITVRHSMFKGGAGGTAYSKVYVNGIAVGTEQSKTSAVREYYTENFVVVAGDLVQLYAKVGSPASSDCDMVIGVSDETCTDISSNTTTILGG